MTWREKAFDGLWSGAPELKSRARKHARDCAWYRDLMAANARLIRAGWIDNRSAEIEFALGLGHHAGRLMALRLEAYDRKETR